MITYSLTFCLYSIIIIIVISLRFELIGGKMHIKYFQKGFNYSQDGPGNRLVYHLHGCNLRCPFCQNYEIAAAREETSDTEYYTPQELCDLALDLRDRGNIGIAFQIADDILDVEGNADLVGKTLQKDEKQGKITLFSARCRQYFLS